MDSSDEEVLFETCCFHLNCYQKPAIFQVACIMNVLAKVMKKCTTFQNMSWSLIVHKNTIKNYSIALKEFSLRSLSFYPLFSFS